MSLKQSTVVITLPTSTTNITGFFIMVRGFSLRNPNRTSAPAAAIFRASQQRLATVA